MFRTVFASFSVTGVTLTKSFFCVNAKEGKLNDFDNRWDEYKSKKSSP